MSSYFQIVWVIGLVSQITLLLVLVRTKRYLVFPLLPCALLWEIVGAVSLKVLVPYSTRHLQFVEYWVLNLVDICLVMMLFFQIGRGSRSGDARWCRRVNRLLHLSAGVGIGAVVLVYGYLLPSSNLDSMTAWDMRFEVILTMISLVLLIAMMSTSNYGGFIWSPYAVVLSKGLVAIQATITAADYSHLVRGWVYSDEWSELVKLAVNTAVMVYWTVECLMPIRERQSSVPENFDVLLRRRAG